MVEEIKVHIFIDSVKSNMREIVKNVCLSQVLIQPPNKDRYEDNRRSMPSYSTTLKLKGQ